MKTTKLSGTLLFLAAFISFLGIITTEAFYPITYTTFKNEFTDLGATRVSHGWPGSVATYRTNILQNKST